ncbi:MAG: type II secretion system F family protein, partial [Candidatus Latescibacteria bacterium]|nr:type II secretion system F family protein [Candidatus Latescibacterota bacterium]
FINLVDAGERAGLVGRVLGQLADSQDREETLRGKVSNALMYPVAIMLVSMGAALVLLTHVIPLFAEMFHQSGVPLPVPTQFVISLSDLVVAYWSWGVILTTSMAYVVFRYCRRPETRLSLDRHRLRLPYLGPIYRGAALSRFTDSLSMLLGSGVPLVTALAAASHTLLNLHLESSIIESASAVNRGLALAASMSGNSVWPEFMTQTIGIGEETGDLASSLQHLASYYSRDVEHRTERLTAIMEPLLIVSVAIVVGGFLIAMYLPIFNLSEVVV